MRISILVPYVRTNSRERSGFNRSSLIEFFKKKPQVVAVRLVVVVRTLRYLAAEWNRQESMPREARTRGKILREELSGLGPCFVKIGQTLSQRPDIVGEEACEELKSLQTENEPFDNDLAMHIIATELKWTGPLAPGVVPNGADPNGEPLFAWISEKPIASASLGQVYRARLHESAAGTIPGLDALDVAVKVQRPEAVRQIALDWTCASLALEALELYWRNFRPSGFEADLGLIADEIASNLFQELNYKQEAKNAAAFVDSLKFLGFVDAPHSVDALTTPCVLTTSWVNGRHLKDLTEAEGLRLTTMAVEACTASLVLTGYVHADPHEGNLMLCDETGRLVFLDFGLMSDVEGSIMEGFARGIQACLSEDYDALAVVFQDVGFVGTPLQWRQDEDQLFENRPLPEFAAELRASMESNPDGTSRFGALAVVLSALGKQWRMYTPPYVLLLIRTFLTLEGIAAKVDPSFNIYAVSLPWAVKRSLSPSSDQGIEALRSTLLTDTNQLQWDRVTRLLTEATEAKAADDKANKAVGRSHGPDAASKSKSRAADKSARGAEAIGALLGTSEGATLRRIAADLDSTDLLLRLLGREGRTARRFAARMLAEKVRQRCGRGCKETRTDLE